MSPTALYIGAAVILVVALLVFVLSEVAGVVPLMLFLVAFGSAGMGATIQYEQTAQERRVALEERYGVDIDQDQIGEGRKITVIIDGDLYTCDVRGTGSKARMYCDEPPRPEFEKQAS